MRNGARRRALEALPRMIRAIRAADAAEWKKRFWLNSLEHHTPPEEREVPEHRCPTMVHTSRCLF